MTRQRQATRDERGQVVVIFALLIPVLLALSAFVIGIGNWFVHGKHLQTKADAGAFAGATEWAFPCGPEIDARIDATARAYAGPDNPQVGGVPDTSIHTKLNALQWYDDDSQPNPAEFVDPANPSLCDAKILDVKVTEDNSFPLASLIPLFPDIKRRARVEIQEAEGISGVLPIAVRAPVPQSIAAVYYNEQTGNILRVRYFVKGNTTTNIITGVPAGLQGWTTNNPDDPVGSWAQFSPPPSTGVVIALSLRGACPTGLPANNVNSKNIATDPLPNCFEDQGFANVNGANGLCNQRVGGSFQIVNCYWANGNWPTETVQSGLHFIRGWSDQDPANGDPPAIEEPYLTNVSCDANAYFSRHPSTACQVRLNLQVDLSGALLGTYPNPSPPPATITAPLRATDVQVRYMQVRANGNVLCNFGNQCDLIGSGDASSNMNFSTQGSASSPHLPIATHSGGNAVAIEIQIRNSPNHPNTNCRGSNFNNNCRWFYTGNGMISTSVAPTAAQVLAAPIQRAFMGDTVMSSSVQWLRLSQDTTTPCDSANRVDDNAASAQNGADRCFRMELGLKGGIAANANDQPILFNDGIGSSQMGSIDCDPNINQGQVLIEGIKKGCGPWYARHPFDWTPACPAANDIFTLPNPGAPWNDGRWPPLRCIKTRPTGSMNQMERGLKGRFFDNENQNSCPGGASGGPGFIKGRNYWDKDTNNGYTGVPPYGYKEGTHDTNFNKGDPRIVTIFLTTTEAFASSGQNTYPIVGFIQVYITGFGRTNGSGVSRIDDPCPGSAPPADLDLSGGLTSGYAVWGHILDYVIPGPGATPSGRICAPGTTGQPCVAVLVD